MNIVLGFFLWRFLIKAMLLFRYEFLFLIRVVFIGFELVGFAFLGLQGSLSC